MTCFDCHKFRIKEKIKEDYSVMLELLRRDRIKEAYDYYDINPHEEKRKMSRIEMDEDINKEEVKQRLDKCKSRIAWA
jgi:hypothetical protein